METAPIRPKVMIALFICSSAYKESSKPLPQAYKDVNAIADLFFNHMNSFKQIILIDNTKEEIDKVFKKKILKIAKDAKVWD